MLAHFIVTVALAGQAATAASDNGRLSGRVVLDGADTPIAGARVMLMPAGRPTGPFSMPPAAITDNNGQFMFDSIPAGEYHIDAQRTGYASPRSAFGPPQAIQIAAGQAATIELRLKKGAVIAGRVFDESGAPLPDIRVMPMRRLGTRNGSSDRLVPAPVSGMSASMQTNDLGEFRLVGLLPGEYFVAAMRSPDGFGGAAVARSVSGPALTTTYYPGTIDQSAAQPIAIAEGDTKGNIEFRMLTAPAFNVSGRVVDEQGQPVAHAMVMLVSDGRGNAVLFGPIGGGQSGDDGRFDIRQVPAGAYRVSASVPVQMNGNGMTTWSSSSGGGASGGTWARVTGGVSGGVVFNSLSGNTESGTADVVVADADVTGIQLIVKRSRQ
jgi:protocatechuate 3,4-dioxygenase beta subunit